MSEYQLSVVTSASSPDDLSQEIEVEKAIQRWRTAPVGTKRQREREVRLARAEQIRKELGL